MKKISSVILISIIFLLLPSSVFADGLREKAVEFVKLNGEKNTANLINRYSRAIIKSSPDLASKEKEIKTLINRLLLSQEYIDLQVEAYSSVYTEKELDLMIDMMKSPGYRLWKEKYPSVMVITQPRLSSIIQRLLIELQQK